MALGVEVDPVRDVADSGRFADDLAALFEVLGETARDLGIGVLVLVDELQEASAEELTAFNTAVHNLGQADVPLPVTFVGAGLPHYPHSSQRRRATPSGSTTFDPSDFWTTGHQRKH